MESLRKRPPEGRIIPLYHLDVHVEARRFGAALLDLIVLAIAATWVDDVFGVTRVTSGSPFRTAVGYTYVTTAVSVGLPWLLLIGVALYSVQEALFRATWGKLVAGLRVVDPEGRRPTFGAVLVRNILRVVDYYPAFYLVGSAVAMFSPRRQRLGDRLAGTLVVRADSAPLAYLPASEVRRRLLALILAAVVLALGCGAFAYYGRPPLVIQGLVNTNRLFDRNGITSYSLGAARWGRGVITYPITYRERSRRAECRGVIVLRWHGFFAFDGGWVLDPTGSASTCG